MAYPFATVLQEAQSAGQLSTALDIHEAAHFIVSSWEGALMRMKVVKSIEPLESHSRFLFDYILKK
jgi:TetR/AcrR family transcriptional regulator, transcriptional repressor for nem operon